MDYKDPKNWHPDIARFWPDWRKLWPSFAPWEVFSPGILTAREPYYAILDPSSLTILQTFRDLVGKPFILNNYADGGRRKQAGCRLSADNLAIGGAKESQHTKGRAWDVYSPHFSPQEIFDLAQRFKLFGFVKLYKTFVHLDTRWKP